MALQARAGETSARVAPPRSSLAARTCAFFCVRDTQRKGPRTKRAGNPNLRVTSRRLLPYPNWSALIDRLICESTPRDKASRDSRLVWLVLFEKYLWRTEQLSEGYVAPPPPADSDSHGRADAQQSVVAGRRARPQAQGTPRAGLPVVSITID